MNGIDYHFIHQTRKEMDKIEKEDVSFRKTIKIREFRIT